MRDASRAIAAAIAVATVAARAETVPPPGPVDSRVRIVAYDPNDVFKLPAYVGFQIHIQWAPGEEFVNLGAGDVGGIEVGSERNHFFIKPKQERVSTNLTVLTTLRAYHFEYKVRKAPPANGSDVVYSIRFVYPEDEARQAAAEAQQRLLEEQLAKAAAERPRNADYWYCGAPALKPLAAHDDGMQTRLRFPARSEFPAIFVRNDDNSESLLNFTVEDDEVVIHRVTRRLVLRRGQLVGCVVNLAFEGGGERPKSNTTVPQVRRETRGATP